MKRDPLSTTFAALADPTRRALLRQLREGEATVNELAAPHAMSLPSVSRHLKVLQEAGLIVKGREAQFRPCRLDADPLAEADAWLAPYRGVLRDTPRASRTATDDPNPTRRRYDDRCTTARLHAHVDTRRPARAGLPAWTDPDQLEWYYNPAQPIPDEPIELDLRVGGVWRQRMVIDEDTAYYTGGVYREIVPGRSLVFAWGATGGWPALDSTSSMRARL